VLLGRERGDVRLDVWVDALVDQRHSGGVPDEAERRSVDDSGVHGGAPFYGQAEPELWLCTKGAAVTTYVAGTGAVHRPEGAAESLGRAVAVPHRDVQELVLAGDHIGRGNRHAAAADVLRQRQTGQRREHPAHVVLSRAKAHRQPAYVDLLGEVLLDQVDQPVEHCDHEAPFHRPA